MGRFKILLVDDDPDILTILKDNLELDDYHVVTAATGAECLDRYDREAVDLVILDLMLPDMDGIQVCRSLRSRSRTPIIMLTARDSVSDRVLGLESGADDYVVKPFDYLELAARIKARLRRGRSYTELEAVLEAGKLRLNPDKREAELDGRRVALTKKEFDLLSLLVVHAGRVLDRNAIRRELWPGEKLYKWSRTIDVHIQHLRSKIEKNPERPAYIKTVPGVGYILDSTE